MSAEQRQSFFKRSKTFLIGASRNLNDPQVFHKLSLTAFLAWVGLGTDGLSSSCYGPAEAFLTLGQHHFLSLFVALLSGITIFIISISYSQIIELFPSGGGGYLVASKLLSPKVGMISGSALLIDYVLTITLSVASGTDALFSFFPLAYHQFKLDFAVFGVVVLIIMNLRGVKEAVVPLVPIFLLFIALHAFVIFYALGTHFFNASQIVAATSADLSATRNQLGFFGMMFIIVKAYTMGAGTYTGIEAVSNGLPILRDPKVHTAKKTMKLMASSLTFMVVGLMIAYLLYSVTFQPGKTLNAVLFENVTHSWPTAISLPFIFIILLSEAVILFVAAQTGFLDGPRVLANMAADRWLPSRFAILSDRLVTQNGILLMGAAALLTMILAKGSVLLLIVLYSINVFITFFLSQLGMVKHWWNVRKEEKKWKGKISINGVGLALTTLILISVVALKFFEGGWITLVVTGSVVALALFIKKHYNSVHVLIQKLDSDIIPAISSSFYYLHNDKDGKSVEKPEYKPENKTAVVLVNGFNGLGVHTLLSVIKTFPGIFKNFVFVQAGVLDAGGFKGSAEVIKLEEFVKKDITQYVDFMQQSGYYADSFTSLGTDVVNQITEISDKVFQKYPNAVFFGGQLVFPNETFFTRLLHNQIVFSVQRRLYHQGYPFVILPIRVTY